MFLSRLSLITFPRKRLGQAITEGILLGTYTFRKHLTKLTEYKDLKEFNLIVENSSEKNGFEDGIRVGKIIAEATILARDLANEPANYLNPGDLAKHGLGCSQKSQY